ncbi:hypothetical protein PhCBS80983_g03866 [Powellomyces hirtus]|uniref:JmjC domain-containing protein n=1 Tax=Powellomyces hirtus TaxID=109895 RepID=A0A507E1Z7_9FUNG|nr:hypothetical protein PhCBS80983_g03866 [Powellomyces hirtus]
MSSSAAKNAYSGFHPPSTSWAPERISPKSITAKEFFTKYIATRTPVILTPFGETLKTKWTPEYLSAKAGNMTVKVEQRDTITGGFGSGGERVEMDFATFLKKVSGGDLYLTTQYREAEVATEDDEILSEDYSEDGSPLVGLGMADGLQDFAPNPLRPLLKDIALRPELLGPLIPQTMNLWLGSTKKPTSSGLHHDYQDNLYTLLEGLKQFTVFSPKDAEAMYTHGEILRVAPNGYVHYTKGIRDDGAEIADVAGWAVSEAERAVEEAEESGKGMEEAEKRLEEAMDGLLAARGESDGEDDFSEGDEGFGDFSGEEDAVEEIDDEDDENNLTTGSGRKRGVSPTPHSAKKTKRADEPKAPPPSFSRIPVTTLRSSTASVDFPLLAKATKITFVVHAGEALYLPTGWFHEVTSSNTGNNLPHMALNHWLAPPTRPDFEKCYEDNYWEDIWKSMEESLANYKP